MKEIDVLGKACPIPVIETKKAFRENPDEKEFEVLVDNEVATENLSKMAKELKIDAKVEKLEDIVKLINNQEKADYFINKFKMAGNQNG